MPARNSPEAAAQAVIDQARADADGRKNQRARRFLPWYRFDELRELQPWQRAQFVHQGCALADREIPVVAACFAWLAFLGIAAFASPSWLHGGGTAVAVVVCALPFMLIRRARVHHHVRALLESERRSATDGG